MNLELPKETMSGSDGIVKRAYIAHTRGEISRETCHRITAMSLSETIHEHRPVNYHIASQNLQSYVTSRDRDAQPRDQTLAVKNGEWLDFGYRVYAKNLQNHELLIWAKEILEKIENQKIPQTILDAIKNHEDHRAAFDWPYYMRALKVQEKDSDERRRMASKHMR